MSAAQPIQAPPPDSGESIDFSFPEGTPDRLVELRDAHGDCFAFHSSSGSGRPCYLLSDPELVSQVLGKNHRSYVKGVGIDRVNILLGRGLMVSEGGLWKSQRRMLQPGFRRASLPPLVAGIVACTEQHIENWHEGHTIDVVRFTSEVTLDFILNAIFSVDLDRLQEREGGNPFWLVADDDVRDLQFARKFRGLARHIQEIIDQRRSLRETRSDLLGLMLAARDRNGQPMSDRQLRDEVLTLIVAGHETTASALSWAWILLAQHADARSKVISEVAALTDSPGAWASQLRWTTAVLYETLRLYPPGWMLARRTVQSHALGQYQLDEDADVLISPYVVQRHPAHWEDPDRFRPDRFLVPGQVSIPAYMPFSSGPRNCIGEHLALLEMQLHLGTISKRFRLALAQESRVEMQAQINLRPTPPVMMKVSEL